MEQHHRAYKLDQLKFDGYWGFVDKQMREMR